MAKHRFMRAIVLYSAAFVSLVLGSSTALAAGINIQNANYDVEGQQLIVKGKVEGFENGVEVALVKLGTGALLASQNTDKQFKFKLPISDFSDVPCDVLVTAGEEFARSDVRHGPGGCTSFEYTLTGIVTDEPIPFATVSVTLDGVTYTTTADAAGNYELPILSSNLNQLVKIDASAENEETGEPINFVNLAGSFSRVLDGNATGNVTNVTTASYVLAVEANGGSEPTTPEELQTAETSIDATELFELAALIKLIVDDREYSLPDGEDSLIEFISDPAAVEAYIENVPQEDLNGALEEILQDSNLVAGFVEEDMPERYYSIPVSAPGFIARSGSALEFDPALTGAILGMDGNSGNGINESFTWSIDDSGRLVVVFDNPVVTTNFPNINTITTLTAEERQILENNNIAQIEEISSTDDYVYTRVIDGTLVDIARVEARYTLSYPPIPVTGGNLELEQSVVNRVDSSEVTLRSSLDIVPISFVDTCSGSNKTVCAVGTWGGVFHYTTSPGVDWYSGIPGYSFPATAYGEIATISPGGTLSTTYNGDTASWSVDAGGQLVIQYADGWTQTLQALDSLGIEYGLFSEFTNGTERYASYSVYSRADQAPVLSDADVIAQPGRYFNGEVNTWNPGSIDEFGIRTPNYRFGWDLEADGSGINRQWGYGFGCILEDGSDGVFLYRPPVAWQLTAGGNVEINRYGVFGEPIRTWYPAATTTIDGDRVLYVLEAEVRVDYDAGNAIRPLFAPRINIQRELDYHSGEDCLW